MCDWLCIYNYSKAIGHSQKKKIIKQLDIRIKFQCNKKVKGPPTSSYLFFFFFNKEIDKFIFTAKGKNKNHS